MLLTSCMISSNISIDSVNHMTEAIQKEEVEVARQGDSSKREPKDEKTQIEIGWLSAALAA